MDTTKLKEQISKINEVLDNELITIKFLNAFNEFKGERLVDLIDSIEEEFKDADTGDKPTNAQIVKVICLCIDQF